MVAPTAVNTSNTHRRGSRVSPAWLLVVPHLLLACGESGAPQVDTPDSGPPRETLDAGPELSLDGGGTLPPPDDDDAGAPVATPDGGPAADAGTEPDPGPEPTPEGVPVFVAQGHMGRTVVSCDDGQSWQYDQSMNDSTRCFDGGPDCDHHAGAGQGLAWGPAPGGGDFYATFGWGGPGHVQRSSDGANWTTIQDGPEWGGIAYGDGVLLLGAYGAQRSLDGGATFEAPVDTGLAVWNVRRAGYAGGRFILSGSTGGVHDVVYSADRGASWQHPTTLPAACGNNMQVQGGILDVGGRIVLVGSDGVACTSTDGGQTFTESRIGSIGSDAVSTGTEAFVWGAGEVHRSTDGLTWTSQPISPANLRLGAVAVSDGGTFVGVNDGWQQAYEAQVFYRSTDGVNWEPLPAGSYQSGHPIRDIQFGYVASCP